MEIMSLYTIFGSSGFIGSEFIKHLSSTDNSIYTPKKNDLNIYKKPLGTVIYCAGYGDCKSDPFNVIDANTFLVKEILQSASFDKFVYISSTRVYMNQDISSEDSNLTVSYDDNRKLFNLSKLITEELCLNSKKNCLVIRPSNIYGLALNSKLFLPSIIRNAINNNIIDMYVDKNYSKDYLSVHDLIDATLRLLSVKNLPSIVNIASGKNTTAEELAFVLEEETSCKVNWHQPQSTCENFPITDISLINKLIDFQPHMVLDDMREMIASYKNTI